MTNTIKVSFWLHRFKENVQGKVPIQIRLVNQTKKVDKATGFYVPPQRWNIKKQRTKGGNDVERSINIALDNFYSKAKAVYNQSQIDGDHLCGHS